jgi:ABC-type glycerol-3-phosphate transport system permease component
MVVTRSFYHETRGVGEKAGKAGWLVESVVLVLCLLWLVPTVGLLVVPNHVAMVPLSVLFHATTWPRCPGQFLWVWNDLLVSLIFLGPGQNQVMTMALAQMLGDRGQGWQLLTAGAFLTMVLPIIVFVTLQRFFVRGLTAGAVKG